MLGWRASAAQATLRRPSSRVCPEGWRPSPQECLILRCTVSVRRRYSASANGSTAVDGGRSRQCRPRPPHSGSRCRSTNFTPRVMLDLTDQIDCPRRRCCTRRRAGRCIPRPVTWLPSRAGLPQTISGCSSALAKVVEAVTFAGVRPICRPMMRASFSETITGIAQQCEHPYSDSTLRNWRRRSASSSIRRDGLSGRCAKASLDATSGPTVGLPRCGAREFCRIGRALIECLVTAHKAAPCDVPYLIRQYDGGSGSSK